MAEKAIIGKMTVYETVTMIVPGTMIVFGVWLLKPQYWMHFLDNAGYTINVNYIYDIALVIMMFALVYIAGLLNYLIIDGIWRILGLRNSTCMIKCVLNKKVATQHYTYLADLVKEKNTEEKEICELNSSTIEDIYYEAYTYALKKNGRSNVPFLENQVAMLKGLIFPMTWIIYLLCSKPWGEYKWIAVIAGGIILIILAIYRQKKTITLVLEDYEYENRIENKYLKQQ